MDKQPETKFLHFRYREKDGNIFARGGRTIAFQETPDGVKYAVALCHLNDNFVKAMGRIKAGGRLNSPTQSGVFPGTEDDFLNAINSDIQIVNKKEKQAAMFAGYDPEYALQLERKYNGKRRGQQAVASVTPDGLGAEATA